MGSKPVVVKDIEIHHCVLPLSLEAKDLIIPLWVAVLHHGGGLTGRISAGNEDVWVAADEVDWSQATRFDNLAKERVLRLCVNPLPPGFDNLARGNSARSEDGKARREDAATPR